MPRKKRKEYNKYMRTYMRNYRRQERELIRQARRLLGMKTNARRKKGKRK